jgi:hypothetical protein
VAMTDGNIELRTMHLRSGAKVNVNVRVMRLPDGNSVVIGLAGAMREDQLPMADAEMDEVRNWALQ